MQVKTFFVIILLTVKNTHTTLMHDRLLCLQVSCSVWNS